MKTKIITEVVTKAMARSGPDLHPDQIRLDDSVQTDKTKVFTQSDINAGMSGGGGGGGGGPAPDLSEYAKTKYVDEGDAANAAAIVAEANARDTADKANLGLIEANKKAIEAIEIPEGGESYDDAEIKQDISDLQDAFDTAVAAAQEGAENLTIELQSYAKKTEIPTDNKDLANGAGYITASDLPEGADLSDYAKTDYVDSADAALNDLIAANTKAIEELPTGGIDWANLPVLAV